MRWLKLWWSRGWFRTRAGIVRWDISPIWGPRLVRDDGRIVAEIIGTHAWSLFPLKQIGDFSNWYDAMMAIEMEMTS